MVKLMGGHRNVPWLAVGDMGMIAARAFADPGKFTNAEIHLASDVKTLDEYRAIWADVFGSLPRKFPMPVAMFERIAGPAGKEPADDVALAAYRLHPRGHWPNARAPLCSRG